MRPFWWPWGLWATLSGDAGGFGPEKGYLNGESRGCNNHNLNATTPATTTTPKKTLQQPTGAILWGTAQRHMLQDFGGFRGRWPGPHFFEHQAQKQQQQQEHQQPVPIWLFKSQWNPLSGKSSAFWWLNDIEGPRGLTMISRHTTALGKRHLQDLKFQNHQRV